MTSHFGSDITPNINRGSCVYALLNLLNEPRKTDKMRGNEFNKFNNTGVRMLDSIYHMTLKLF